MTKEILESHQLSYKDGTLHLEQASVASLAEKMGTPLFLYSQTALESNLEYFQEYAGDSLICYALKANSNLGLLKVLAKKGAGADIVSGGELEKALRAGFPAEKIVFSGIGKTAVEIQSALKTGILQLNVESMEEIDLTLKIAADLNSVAPLSLRVNPNVDAGTHEKITTGLSHNKFGIPWGYIQTACKKIIDSPHGHLRGLAMHIGSQITSTAPYQKAYGQLRSLVLELKDLGIQLETLDLGGGYGILYKDEKLPNISDYLTLARQTFQDLDLKLIFEPGRSIVGNAGILVSKVLYVKHTPNRTFVIIDAGMNDMIRPSLYDAYHHILPVQQPADHSEGVIVDIVGPICESSDIFAKDRLFPEVKAGDLIALCSAGAYCSSMSSTYNVRTLPAEAIVYNTKVGILKQRQSLDDLINQESIPDWL